MINMATTKTSASTTRRRKRVAAPAPTIAATAVVAAILVVVVSVGLVGIVDGFKFWTAFGTRRTSSTTTTARKVKQLLQKPQIQPFTHKGTTTKQPLFSSFAADGSEYSGSDASSSADDDDRSALRAFGGGGGVNDDENENDDIPTIELKPVPLSKNSGNRFVALIWDREFRTVFDKDNNNKDPLDWHYERVALTEEQVMYCRKANLYNETFNTDSAVDVLFSFPILASDLKRVIGHAMILESTELSHVKNFLKDEPIFKMLTQQQPGNDDDDLWDRVPACLYRWRHIRDYTLRMDDGRFGYPCLCVAFDQDAVDDEKKQLEKQQLEYLIRSERVIAAGPLHLPTELKDDPSSLPVGDFMLFNADAPTATTTTSTRDGAIHFCEHLPSAQQGLYKDMRVYFYNSLDITGKFVSEDPLGDAPCGQLKEAMEVWGYPVADDQTPWLNW